MPCFKHYGYFLCALKCAMIMAAATAVAVDEKWEKSLLLLYLKSFAKSQEVSERKKMMARRVLQQNVKA